MKLDGHGDVVLYDRVLVEDDGPGIGSDAWWMKTDRAPVTEFTPRTRIKKVLHIDQPAASEAWLYVPTGMHIEFNGHPLAAGETNSFVSVPVALLKRGDNEVVLHDAKAADQHIKIATRDDIIRNEPDRRGRPRRSYKSVDDGMTWQPIEGEYMIRLHLLQNVPHGEVISPVIDLGREPDDDVPLVESASIESVRLTTDADTPEGTRVELAMRTGSSPVYEPGSWTDWQTVGSRIPAGHHHLQWKATLYSTDPLRTPVLRSVTVEAGVRRHGMPAWAKSLKVVSFHNEEIRSTSMPFEYEDPLHPQLVALRKKYRLDDVVAGAKTETAQMVKLRDWVAQQWKYQPPEENYPPWDADEILTRKTGFCVQYAVVFLQCALSLGHQARFVFGYNPGAFDGGGHEVCEVWSNEHRKWIFYDVHQNWHYVDAATRTPLSMLEVHDLILKTSYGDRPADPLHPPLVRRPTERLAICYGTNMVPGLPPAEYARHYVDGQYTAPTRWLFIHYLPRNNFFAATHPLPKTQGTHWDWSDYWCWEDALTPKRWQYRNFTARRSDLDWTINQVRFEAIPGAEAGKLKLRMATVTPHADTFLVKLDQQDWKSSGREFDWQLHPGSNRVEMRMRNTSGVLGPVSFLEVE